MSPGRGRVAGKVAIVTGGGSGIGAATASMLAVEEALVAVADIDGARAEEVATRIVAGGGQALAVRVDVAVEDEVKAMVDRTMEAYGRLDVLCNIAAAVPPSPKTVVDIDLEDWDRELRVNLTGPMLASRHAIPHMIEGGGGSIVHASSSSAIRADTLRVGYAASKVGIFGLSRSIAAGFGKQGVRSNVICPGITMSPTMARHPAEYFESAVERLALGRIGTPEDQAAAFLFLASDESAFITGQVLPVEGGATIKAGHQPPPTAPL